MARTAVSLVGDSCRLQAAARAITASPDLEFVFGAFVGSPEERRVVVLHVGIAGDPRIVVLRLEITDPTFIEHSVVGGDVYPKTGPEGDQTEVA